MQRGRGFSMLYFPLPLQKQGKWKHRLCSMHYDTGLYSASWEEKIAVDEVVLWSTLAATSHLCTCGATPMGNLKCRRIRKEYKSGRKVGFRYGSPSIPSLPTYSKFLTPLFVTNSIWNSFLSGQMLWAPFLRPLGVTSIWTWNSKYNCRNLQTKTGKMISSTPLIFSVAE